MSVVHAKSFGGIWCNSVPSIGDRDTVHWGQATCIACLTEGASTGWQAPKDRLAVLTAQSPPARKWFANEWQHGNCAHCGVGKRDISAGETHFCATCWNIENDVRGTCMQFNDYAQSIGMSLKYARRPVGNTPAPSKQEPTREHAVTVDVKNMDVVKEAIAARDALLTRCIAFLNDVGISEQRAMSTARNNERAQLVRDIKEAIVPADKKR